MSKIVNKFSLGLTVAVGVALFAYYQSDSTIEDVGEQIALKLLEILPRKSKIHQQQFRHQQQQQRQEEPAFAREKKEFESPPPPPRQQPPTPSNETKKNKQPEPVEEHEEPAVELSKSSIFDPVGHYNPKEAMQRRFDALRDACMGFQDFLRPERAMTEVVPDKEELLLHPPSQLLLCPIEMVAKRSMNTFFTRIKEPGSDYANKIKSFNHGFPRSAAKQKKAIVVRHPMERLVAAYRYKFEKSYNAATGEEEGGDITFPEFIDVVLNGHIEFAEFLEENGLGSTSHGNGNGGQSAAIDTGMIDGTTGASSAWNPYWKQCGVCHPDFMPHFILHLNHFQEDSAVLVEVMGHPRHSKDFIGVAVEPKSGLREVEEHYWAQISKQDVKDLYDKYRIDHDLFGFTPEYYVALAREDEEEDEEEEEDEV